MGEIKPPIFSQKLFSQLGAITLEQAENGEGLEIARRVYRKAVKVGDDTTANEARHYEVWLEDTEKLGSRILRHYKEAI